MSYKQLSVVGDSHRNKVVLGLGRFGVCKFTCMSFPVQSSTINSESTTKETVAEEACVLSHISHKAFPFLWCSF